MDYKWLTVKQIIEDSNYPFSAGQVYHYLLHRHKNGLHTAVRKIGKCLFVRKDLFEDWIESKKEEKHD